MSKRRLYKAVWETESFIYRLKIIQATFNILNFWVCVSFPYTENWNWLHWINLEKFDFIVHFNFKYFKQRFKQSRITASVWAWIDDFKSQIFTLQNQRVGDEKYKYFPKIRLRVNAYLNLLRQVRCFVIWWVDSSISSNSNHTQNIIMETIEVEIKEIDQDRILTYSILWRWLVLLDNS